MTNLENRMGEASEKLVDPETGLTFGEMDMITDMKEKEPGVVNIDFVPLNPFCPIAFKLAIDIRKAVTGIEGVKKALVYSHDHTIEEAINKKGQQTIESSMRKIYPVGGRK